MPRYFLDLPEDPEPRRWDPHAGPRPERADTRYFGAAFCAMERTLEDADIDVHLTWDGDRLPDYGPHVVAVLLRDDGGRVPRYSGRVRAVFKSYGTRPVLGTGPLRDPGITGLMELAQYGVRWLRWLPGGSRHAARAAARRLRGVPELAPVRVIPLGTLNQISLPPAPIEDRPTDVFFAGSVEHQASLRRLWAPKTRSRRAMLNAVRRIAAEQPALRLDLRVTSAFDASAASSPDDYSRRLMDAQVCLAPRGSSVETFRVLEGLRAGCVVVAERLPAHWFYTGAPVIQLDRWAQLNRVLARVLSDPDELRRLHRASLGWWEDHCSEEAVGRFMANHLNDLRST